MPLPSILDCCRVDLLEPEDALLAKYPPLMARRIMRIREIYNMWLSNPTLKDKQLRDQIMSRFGISQSAAYSDLSVVHQLIPLLSQNSRQYHRARFVEMCMETYSKGKARNDVRSMASVIATYGKVLKLDEPDEIQDIYDQMHVQPFCAGTDPRPLGIKEIPDIYNYIDRLTKDLYPDHPDMIDVEYEEVDLEEDIIFKSFDSDADKS